MKMMHDYKKQAETAKKKNGVQKILSIIMLLVMLADMGPSAALAEALADEALAGAPIAVDTADPQRLEITLPQDYSVEGCQQMLLSDLLGQLDAFGVELPEVNLADVAAVAFTDDRAVTAQQVSGVIQYNNVPDADAGENNFLLTSEAPFTVEEQFTIVLKTGETVEIGRREKPADAEEIPAVSADYTAADSIQILLSDLMRQYADLGIELPEVNLADVAAVSFTGEHAVTVQQVSGVITYNNLPDADVGEHDFLLTSAEPFTTEEQFSLTLANGETVKIGAEEEAAEGSIEAAGDVKATVVFDQSAGLPATVTLTAEEVTENDENYSQYEAYALSLVEAALTKTAEAPQLAPLANNTKLNTKSVGLKSAPAASVQSTDSQETVPAVPDTETAVRKETRLAGVFDLTILDGDTPRQPDAPVTVTVELAEALPDNCTVYAIHFTGDGTAEAPIPATVVDGTKVSFPAGGFSVYIITYTVEIVEIISNKGTISLNFTDYEPYPEEGAESVFVYDTDDCVVRVDVETVLSLLDAANGVQVDAATEHFTMDLASLSPAAIEGGVAYEKGELIISAEGSIELTDGKKTLTVSFTGITRLKEEILKAEGMEIEVEEGNVPLGSQPRYTAHTDEETAALVDAYKLEEDNENIAGFRSADLAIVRNDQEVNAEGQFKVTLDKSALIPEGMKLETLYHIHDGKAEELAVTETENGLEFMLSNFSDLVASYTVDFTYTDPFTQESYTYNLHGGTDMLLSDLLKELNIEADLTASETAFSDDMPEGLVELAPVYGEDGETVTDWMLTSQASFTTEHTLTVTLSNGTDVVLGVTDSAEIVQTGTWGSNANAGTWIIDQNGVLTVSGTGVMPNYNANNGITTAPWGAYADQITSISITDGITDLGSRAFQGLTNVTAVDFSACSTLRRIKGNAFNNCMSLEAVNLSNCTSLEYLGGNADSTGINDSTWGNVFSGCTSLTTVNLTGCTNLKKIYNNAFNGCIALETVNLTGCDALDEIGNSAFRNTAIKDIDLSTNGNLTYIGEDCFNGCANLETADFSGTKLTSIQQRIFNNCTALKKLDFSNSTITTISSSNAFSNCNSLESVSFKDCASLTALPNSLFEGRTLLSSVDLSGCSSLATIGQKSFKNTAITSLDLSELPITKIDSNAFEGCKQLTTVAMPKTLSVLNGGVFNSCDALNSVSFKDCASLTALPNSMFEGRTQLTNVDLAGCSSLEEIGSKAFRNTALTTDCLDLSDTALITIGSEAFYNCAGIVNLVLPASIITLKGNAFNNCSSLTSVVFSRCENLETVEGSVFSNCTALESIDWSKCKRLSTVGNQVFNNCSSLKTADFSNIAAVTLGNEIFRSCTALTTFVMTNCPNYTELNGMISGCNALETVDLSNNPRLTTISSNACRYKPYLTTFNLAGSPIKEIGAEAFRDDPLLQFNLNDIPTIEILRNGIFSNSPAPIVEDITAFTELRIVYSGTFSNNPYITDLDLSNCKKLQYVGERAFAYIPNLETVNFSGAGTESYDEEGNFIGFTLGNQAFDMWQYSSYIRSIDFSNSGITQIGDEAFRNHPYNGHVISLESVNLTGCTALISIGKSAFGGYADMDVTGFETLSALEEIKEGAFINARSIENVDLSRSTHLTLIGDSAFEGCTKLGTVKLDNGISSLTIGNKSFYNTALNMASIPNSVVLISDSAFQKANTDGSITTLQSVYWDAEEYTAAPSAKWFNNSTYDLTIGKDVNSLPTGFFSTISGYVDLFFEGENQQIILTAEAMNGAPGPLNNISGKFYVDSHGVLYKLEENEGVKTATLVYCPPKLGTYEVPDHLTVNGENIDVTAVGDSAFVLAKSLSAITFTTPDNIQSIGENAFYGLKALKTVNGKTSLAAIKGEDHDKNGHSINQDDKVFNKTPDNKTLINSSAFTSSGIVDDVSKYPWDAGTRGTSLSSDDINVLVRANESTGPFRDENGVYQLLTGENLTLEISAQNRSGFSQYAFIYLGFSDTGYSELKDVNFTSTTNAPIADLYACNVQDSGNIKAMVVKVYPGQTADQLFNLQYMSGQPGGSMNIWLVQPEDEELVGMLLSANNIDTDEALKTKLIEKLTDTSKEGLAELLRAALPSAAVQGETEGEIPNPDLKNWLKERIDSFTAEQLESMKDTLLEKYALDESLRNDLTQATLTDGIKTILNTLINEAPVNNLIALRDIVLDTLTEEQLKDLLKDIINGEALTDKLKKQYAISLLSDDYFHHIAQNHSVTSSVKSIPEGGSRITAEWKTIARERNTVKTARTPNVDIVGDGQGEKALLGENSWNVSLNIKGTDKNGIGADYLYEATYTDVLQLKTPFSLDSEIADAITSGNWRWTSQAQSNGSSKYYISIGTPKGWRDAFYIEMPEGASIHKLNISLDGNNRPVLEWTMRNNGTSELSAKTMVVGYLEGTVVGDIETIKHDIETAKAHMTEDDKAAGKKAIADYEIKNEVDAVAEYKISGQVDKSINAALHAEATLNAHAKEADIDFQKTRQQGEEYTALLGSDMTFTITAENIGVPTIDSAATITDSLRQGTGTDAQLLYITPANMERMFLGELGGKLTITINNASLFTEDPVSGTVSDIANGTAKLTNDNSAKEYNIINREEPITITYDAGAGQFLVNGTSYASVEAGLNALGYRVTALDYTDLSWSLENEKLFGGRKITLPVYATHKDTFHLLTADNKEYIRTVNENSLTWPMEIDNRARLTFDDESGKEASCLPYKVTREISIGKKITGHRAFTSASTSVASVSNSSAINYGNGDTVRYQITVNNQGKALSNMPLTDEIIGAQKLLVPADYNDIQALSGLVQVQVNGKTYYALSEGEYHNIWVSEQSSARAYYAESITVADGKTTVKWYYNTLPTGTRTIEYYTLLDTEGQVEDAYGGYSFTNRAYLNDRKDDRLYADISEGGHSAAQYGLNKQIVTANPGEANEQIDPDGLTSISLAKNKVTYKITISSARGAKDIAIYWKNIIDTLPQTYGKFAWQKGGEGAGSVSIVFKTKDENVELFGASGIENAWSISASIPNRYTETENQYFIYWPTATDGEQGDYLLFKEESAAYLYVTLQFPTEENAWHEYCEEVEGRLLRNKVEYGERSAAVYHNAVDKGQVVLQKGVANIYQMGLTADREKYGNTSGYVEYYVALYNGGNSRFYLNDLTDTLPKGFTFQNLRSTHGGNGADTSATTSITTRNSSANLNDLPAQITDNKTGRTVRYVSAAVSAIPGETDSNGVQQVVFSFANSSCTDDGSKGYTGSVHYDSYVQNGWFLLPGEAIVFSYNAKVSPNVSETADRATNRVTMDYYDPEGGGVELYENAAIHGYNRSSGVYNDGEQRIGNSASGTSRQLSSQVDVIRGKVLPGIKKNLTRYSQDNTEGEGTNYMTLNTSSYTRLTWETEAYSSGERGLANYTIADYMDEHFYFGHYGESAEFYPVYYRVMQGNSVTGRAQSTSGTEVPLFSVRYNPQDQKYYVKDSYDNSVKEVGTSFVTVHIPAMTWKSGRAVYENDNQLYVQVKFSQDSQRQVMEIHFPQAGSSLKQDMFPLQPGERGVLTYDTMSGTVLSTKTYNNTAQLLPQGEQDKEYEPGNVDIGTPIYSSNGSNLGVESQAGVSLVGLFATSSEKFVQENNREDAVTGRSKPSANETNTVLLQDISKSFTYTLEVGYQGGAAMSKMVIIDNLPEVGDTYTLSNSERHSQFQVDLAESPNIQVLIWKKNATKYTTVDDNKYTITYSTQTYFPSENEAWTKPNATGWTQVVSQDTRSFRVWIKEGVVEPGDTVHILVTGAVHDYNDKEQIPNLRGKTAYNSFAYQYTVGGTVNTDGSITGGTTLVAATERVGVRIPDYPKIMKKLENYEHGEAKADKDYSFQFLVFEYDSGKLSNALHLDDQFNLESLEAALTANRLNSFAANVSVEHNQSKSEAVSLYHFAENGFIWTEGKQYAIVEIPHETYVMDGWTSVASAGGSTVKTLTCNWTKDGTPMSKDLSMITFTYKSAVTETFTATNIDHRWTAEFTKVDARTKHALTGAVFARYEEKGVEMDRGSLKNGIKKDIEAGYPNLPREIETADRIRWVLVDVVEVDSNGQFGWKDLQGENYLLREITAPLGYNLLTDDIRFSKYDTGVNSNVLMKNIENTPGVELPATGGPGFLSYTVLGVALTFLALILLLKRRKEQN